MDPEKSNASPGAGDEASVSQGARGARRQEISTHLLSDKVLDCAVAMIRNYGARVFPARNKVPLTSHGFNDATAAIDKLRRMWTTSTTEYGVVMADAGRIVVIDADEKYGGDDSLRELRDATGPWPDTACATSPGGTHTYFRLPEGKSLKRRTKNALPAYRGIDVLGVGGYVIGPGSVRPDGGRYEWDLDPEEYGIAEIPEALYAYLKKQEEPERTAWDEHTTWTLPDKIIEGGRDTTLTSFAGKLRYANLSEREIFTALAVVNQTRCVPPLEERDLKRISHSIGQKAPGPDLLREAEVMGSIPPPRITAAADLVPEIISTSTMPRVKTPFPRLNARLGDLRLSTSTNIISTFGGGKTALVLQMSAFHALSAPVLFYAGEVPPYQLSGRVVAQQLGLVHREVLDGLVPEADMRAVLAPLDLTFVHRTRAPMMAVKKAYETAAQRGVVMLVIDYVQLLADLSKTDNARVATMRALEDLKEFTESNPLVTLLVSQGSRNAGRTMQSASGEASELMGMGAETSAIERDAANELTLAYMKRDDQVEHDVTMNCSKVRFGATGKIGFKFNGATGLWTEQDRAPLTHAQEERRDAICTSLRAAGGPLSKNKIRDRDGKVWVKGDKAAVNREIDAMVSEGTIELRDNSFALIEGAV